MLVHYSWPGNIRELEAVIRQSLLQTTGAVILPEFLPDSVRFDPGEKVTFDPEVAPQSDLETFLESRLRSGNSQDLYLETLEMMERFVITRVLKYTEGNQSQAAKILGITRGTLRNKIRALHISLGTTVTLDEEPAVVQ